MKKIEKGMCVCVCVQKVLKSYPSFGTKTSGGEKALLWLCSGKLI